MLIKDQIRQLIPEEIKNQSTTLSGEITHWLNTQNIDAYASVAYGVDGHKIMFPDPHHRTMFLLKYSQYVII